MSRVLKLQVLRIIGLFEAVMANSLTTALHSASKVGDIHTLKTLLAKGADPNSRHVARWTALHTAALHDQYDAIRILLESGADPNLSSRFVDLPRDIANARGHTRLSILLNAFTN